MIDSTMPRVSAIVPTYNRSRMLVETARSVLEQSFRDLELIVVDDGSTDDTEERIAELGDSRIRYVRQERAGRPAIGRNHGLRLAQGELIAFIDDDDLWRPRKLERQVQRFDADARIGLCYTNAHTFHDDPAQHGERPLIAAGRGLEGQAFEALYGHPKVPNLTVMVRRAALDEVGTFDEDEAIRGCEDYELWLRVAARWPLAYVDEPLAFYRVNRLGSISQSLGFFRAQLALIQKVDGLYPDFVRSHGAERRAWLGHCHGQLGRAALRRGEATVARPELATAYRLARKPKDAAGWLLSWLGGPTAARILRGRNLPPEV